MAGASEFLTQRRWVISVTISAALHHVTHYKYDRPVVLEPQTVRLRPAPHCRTKILSYSLKVTPPGHFVNWQQDPHGNWLARFVFPEKVTEFKVEADLTAELAVINPFDFFIEPYAEQFPFAYEPELKAQLAPYLETEAPGPRLAAYIASLPKGPVNTVGYLVDLNTALHKAIRYVIRMEPGVQTPEETLELGSGSCRDSAWLLVQMLRHLGLAARFVSGYLIQLRADIEPLEGPKGPQHDFTDLHAWAEVYIPGAGWIGMDATSGMFCGEGHLPLCATPHYRSAAPISGLVEPANVDFHFDMRVTRVGEAPRVTLPFSEAAWARLDALGEQVDADLIRNDVRLTMGGEPTFVSIDDFESAEWNTAAIGPTKRALADKLIRRLRERFAPGGVLHYGQGKWYPGESLPRWAFALYWRADGVPLWKNADRIAAEAADHLPNAEDARRLTGAIADRLGLDGSYILPAYEDFWHHLAQERQLAHNVDPRDSKLEDPELRARLARVFERGLSRPVGYVLPVEKGVSRWLSEHWTTRSGHLFLLPGDSAIGFRLPLNSLPYVPPSARNFVPPPDPFAPLPPLQPRDQSGQGYRAGAGDGQALERAAPFRAINREVVPQTSEPVVRTALTVEPRDGRICVFMPPVPSATDYFTLLSAVEDSAEALGLSVHVEGYPPPYDPRINVIKVTPDPGVIEVNIHPARSWREQIDITKGLYEEAHACRLSTEKFMLDGRHTGRGGGNHIVVG